MMIYKVLHLLERGEAFGEFGQDEREDMGHLGVDAERHGRAVCLRLFCKQLVLCQEELIAARLDQHGWEIAEVGVNGREARIVEREAARIWRSKVNDCSERSPLAERLVLVEIPRTRRTRLMLEVCPRRGKNEHSGLRDAFVPQIDCKFDCEIAARRVSEEDDVLRRDSTHKESLIDRYWFGDVSRISPEAPVPVAKIGRIDQRAGGAANVARNIASLGGKAGLLSVTGDDEAANALDALMVQDGVSSYLMRDKQIATTVKLRVVARNQQLIRLDFEESPHREVLEQIKHQYREVLPEYDAIIFSDYGKGGLSHISDMIDWARQAGKPVLIDPKGDDYEKYAGATLITPNRAELKEVVGSWKNENDLTEKAQNLRRHLDLAAILLTRSEEGMTLFNEGEPIYQPTRAQEVYDVSGAGDTVIAGVGLGLAAGYTMPEAMHLANTAAGVVVAKLGTAVCSFAELTKALEEQ